MQAETIERLENEPDGAIACTVRALAFLRRQRVDPGVWILLGTDEVCRVAGRRRIDAAMRVLASGLRAPVESRTDALGLWLRCTHG